MSTFSINNSHSFNFYSMPYCVVAAKSARDKANKLHFYIAVTVDARGLL